MQDEESLERIAYEAVEDLIKDGVFCRGIKICTITASKRGVESTKCCRFCV
jgi:hypothetical protein